MTSAREMSLRTPENKGSAAEASRLQQVLAAGAARQASVGVSSWQISEKALQKDANDWVLEIAVASKDTGEPPAKAGSALRKLEDNASGAYRVDFRLRGLKYGANREKYGAALADKIAEAMKSMGRDADLWQPLWTNDSYTCGDAEASFFHIVAMAASLEISEEMMSALGFGFESDALMQTLFPVVAEGDEAEESALPFLFERLDVLRGSASTTAKYQMKHYKGDAAARAEAERLREAVELARQRRR